MINFFHKLFNPHCEHCREEEKENRICGPCEDKKLEMARMQEMIDKLLDRLLEKPEVIQEEHRPANITKPTYVPWSVRKQILEEQDRHKAKLMKEAPKPDPQVEADIKSLEVDLGVEELEQKEA